jgi:hypothetical protein
MIDRTAGRVDVQIDRFAAVLRVEIKHLGNEAVSNAIVHLRSEEKNALNTETGVDVDPALHLAAGKTIRDAGSTDRHGSGQGSG